MNESTDYTTNEKTLIKLKILLQNLINNLKLHIEKIVCEFFKTCHCEGFKNVNQMKATLLGMKDK